MVNPNIVNVSSIQGKTSTLDVTTTATGIVTNALNSNSIFKINSLIVSNIDEAISAGITVDLFRSNVSTKLASSIVVPAESTLVLISKDTYLYLEEGDSLRCLGSANADLQAICSYEIISEA